MELHVVGLTSTGMLFHTIRDVNRPLPLWDPWEDIIAGGAGNAGSPFLSIDCAAVDNQAGVRELHVCGVTADGRLLHTIRFGPGNWQAWGDAGGLGLADYDIERVGVAGINGELHVCVSAIQKPTGGGETRPAIIWDLWHAIRFSNPLSWQSFNNVNQTSARHPNFRLPWGEIGCANVNGLLHVCAIGSDPGRPLWHTIRFPNDWQLFQDVKPTQSNNPGYSHWIGIAGIGGSLHLCLITDGGDLWHTIRIDDTHWQPFFGNVRLVVEPSRPPTFRTVSCASVDGDLHVCAVADAGSILHTIRFSNPPDWQRPFGDLTAVVGALGINPGGFLQVSVAGL